MGLMPGAALHRQPGWIPVAAVPSHYPTHPIHARIARGLPAAQPLMAPAIMIPVNGGNDRPGRRESPGDGGGDDESRFIPPP